MPKTPPKRRFCRCFGPYISFKIDLSFILGYTKLPSIVPLPFAETGKSTTPGRKPVGFQDRDQEDGCPSVNPEENAEVQDEILRVRKGLELLGSDYRQVLILKEMEEMDYQTISELLDIPIGTVRSRLHRARQELRWILEQWDTRSTPKSEENSFGN